LTALYLLELDVVLSAAATRGCAPVGPCRIAAIGLWSQFRHAAAERKFRTEAAACRSAQAPPDRVTFVATFPVNDAKSPEFFKPGRRLTVPF
jgi:hypothetical protein